MSRRSVSFSLEQDRYIDSVARRGGITTAELIREAALRYCEQALADLTRETGGKTKPRGVRARRKARPQVDLVRHLCAKYGWTAEQARRRIALGMVQLDGSPYSRPTITKENLARLDVRQ